ncbi:hypothetical protein F5Y15DRAFT_319552 [Xylariaceae sp. FL0016]|nr:hypothetical protein F5Y15DRAFT_319552 [Xylariaceae sp. FL0016]
MEKNQTVEYAVDPSLLLEQSNRMDLDLDRSTSDDLAGLFNNHFVWPFPELEADFETRLSSSTSGVPSMEEPLPSRASISPRSPVSRRRMAGRQSGKEKKQTTETSQRPHYAVEKRYRSLLNEKYATLGRALAQMGVQRICRTEVPDWTARINDNAAPLARQSSSTNVNVKQSKMTALLAATETIAILHRCCCRKQREVHELRQSVQELSSRIKVMLGTNTGGSAEFRGSVCL